MTEQSRMKEVGLASTNVKELPTQPNFLKRHSLVIGIILIFLYTWTIDLSNSDVLPFRVPFVIALTVGWGFIFVSLLMTRLTLGKEAMLNLLKRFLIWRVNWTWYLVALLLMPALQFASILSTTWLMGSLGITATQ